MSLRFVRAVSDAHHRSDASREAAADGRRIRLGAGAAGPSPAPAPAAPRQAPAGIPRHRPRGRAGPPRSSRPVPRTDIKLRRAMPW